MSSSSNSDDEIDLTDGQTSPSVTDQDKSEDSIQENRSISSPTISRITDFYNKLTQHTPIPPEVLIALIAIYTITLITTALLTSPFNTFGLLSITSGAIILSLIHHPAGKITPANRVQSLTYNGVALSFIGVGTHYALMGLMFEYPGFLI